jgi:drug/metabolite transporter (DMT)-like permease
MIEIFLLSFLCKKMGSNLRDKGWGTTLWMQLAVVIAWFGSMFAAGFGYGIYVTLTQGPAAVEHPNLMVLYPLCLLAGAAGVGLLFTIVSFFPSHELPETWTITADSK